MQEMGAIEKQFIVSIEKSSIARDHVLKALAGHEEYAYSVKAYREFLLNVNYKKTIVEAFLFAIEKHEGQYYAWNKGKKLPYAYHLCKCALNTAAFSFEDKHIVIALWHDMLEDYKATGKDIANELKRYFFDANGIMDALAALDKGNSASPKEYFSKILHNKDACLVKAADIISNLNECIDRFDEMIKNEQRFWIYGYLIDIPKYFLNSKLLPAGCKKAISEKISNLKSLLPDKNKKELRHHSNEVI